MSTNPEIRRSFFFPTFLGFLLASCLTPAPPTNPDAVQLERYRISCEDAHRYAARALKTKGYRISAVDQSPSGGIVEGKKASGDSASIRISCGADGVTIKPSGGLWEEQGTRLSFSHLVEFGDRIWPPPTSLQVRMELVSGAESKLDFPREIESLGLAAARVRIFNGGARTIRVDPSGIRVRAAGGSRVAALSEASVRERFGGMDPSIGDKILRPAKLRQGEETRGFVFFPAGVYTSAVLRLIDDPSNEADEFDVSLVASP